MHERAEMLTGAATSAAATATEIMILLNIELCDSTRHAARRIVQQITTWKDTRRLGRRNDAKAGRVPKSVQGADGAAPSKTTVAVA